MSFMSRYSVTDLVMKRSFRSTPETVFDAFLKPDFMKKWFLTREFTNKVVTNEPFVGGKWEVVDHRDGKDYRAIGEYLEIDRPKRLVLTYMMPQFGDAIDTITVEFAPVDEGCEMTFTHSITVPHEAHWTAEDIAKAEAEHRDAIEHGWNLMFGGLKELVEAR